MENKIYGYVTSGFSYTYIYIFHGLLTEFKSQGLIFLVFLEFI